VTNPYDRTVAGYRAIGARRAQPVVPIENWRPAANSVGNWSIPA